MKKVIYIVILIVLVLIISFKFSNTPTGPKELTFGEISGVTGPYGAVGESFDKGVKLAQEEWNKTHPDRQIKIIFEDDSFDAKKGLSAYNKLTSVDKVDGLVNMTTITVDVAHDSIIKTGIPVAQGFEQTIEAEDDNIVQLWPGTAPAEIALGKAVADKGYKNLALFVSGESAAFSRFADAFKEGYGLPVQEFKVTDSSDMRTEVLKALAAKPDGIVIITIPKQGALIVKQVQSISKEKVQFIFDANVQTGYPDYKKILGDTNVLNGSILYTVPTRYTKAFNDAFKDKYGVEASIGAETGYNAFKLLAQSYDVDKKKWVNNMKTAKFVGADGNIQFDKNGVRIPEMVIGTIENGELPK